LTYQANKLMKRVKMTNLQKAQNWVNSGANEMLTAVCTCNKCSGKPFVKIHYIEYAKLADKTGINPFDNSKQMMKLNHIIVQGEQVA
jgi:hypothetical protein